MEECADDMPAWLEVSQGPLLMTGYKNHEPVTRFFKNNRINPMAKIAQPIRLKTPKLKNYLRLFHGRQGRSGHQLQIIPNVLILVESQQKNLRGGS